MTLAQAQEAKLDHICRKLQLQPGDCCLIGTGVWHEHVPVRAGTVFFAQGFLPTASDVLLGDHRRRFCGLLTVFITHSPTPDFTFR